jgi:hypothetical protein
VFRVYFDTNLLLAESKGMISHAYQQFWMGHKGDIEAVYTVNKKKLPDEVVEDMRAKYAKVASELLETSSMKAKASSEAEERGLRRILRVAGKTDEETARLVQKIRFSHWSSRWRDGRDRRERGSPISRAQRQQQSENSTAERSQELHQPGMGIRAKSIP